MSGKINWEKDHRRHLPVDLSPKRPPICVELERAQRHIPRIRVGRADAFRDLTNIRKELAAAILLAQSEAFRGLLPSDGRRPHRIHRQKIINTLKKLDDLPRELLYKYSNAWFTASDPVISTANRLSAQYSHWRDLLKDH